jgi:hypothetical protein
MELDIYSFNLFLSCSDDLLAIINLRCHQTRGSCIGTLCASIVPPGTEQVAAEVEHAEHGEHPVEEVQPILVEVVVSEPPSATVPRRDPVDQRDEHRAEVEPERVGTVRERREEGLHAGARLLVEELDEPHGGEHLRHAEDEELRHDPEDGHLAALRGGVPAPALDVGRRDHREREGGEADADALERGDPGPGAREALHERDEEELVGRDERQQQGVRDGLQRRGRDAERARARRERRVHGAALLHRERLQLREHGVEDDGAREDGRHGEERLCLLHLGHRAQPPRALRLRVRPLRRCRDACLVQEPSKTRQLITCQRSQVLTATGGRSVRCINAMLT